MQKVAEVLTIQAAASHRGESRGSPCPNQPAGVPRPAWTADFEAYPLMRSQVYEIIFAGQAGSVLRAEFDDCEVSMGEETTTLRVELPDQAALWEMLERVMGFGLELIEVRLVAVPSAMSGDGSGGQGSSAG